MRAGTRRSLLVLLTVVILVAGCGTAAPSPTPSPSPAPTAAPASGSPSIAPSLAPSPSALPTPTPAPADQFLGQLVVTVSDRLLVRSQPWVGEDSIKYTPLLPLGTELEVLDGPIEGSGYTWYQVEPVGFTLEAPGYGWVAAAGKDGEPWIALAGEAIPTPPASAEPDIAGIELAKATVSRAPADPAAARTAAASINALGLDLLRAMLADPKLQLADKNAVFSLTSIHASSLPDPGRAFSYACARISARNTIPNQQFSKPDRYTHRKQSELWSIPVVIRFYSPGRIVRDDQGN